MSQENLNAISSKRHNLALILIGANLIKIVNKVKFKCLKGLYLHEISFFSLEVKLKNDSPGWHFPGMVLESMTIEWFVCKCLIFYYPLNSFSDYIRLYRVISGFVSKSISGDRVCSLFLVTYIFDSSSN